MYKHKAQSQRQPCEICKHALPIHVLMTSSQQLAFACGGQIYSSILVQTCWYANLFGRLVNPEVLCSQHNVLKLVTDNMYDYKGNSSY